MNISKTANFITQVAGWILFFSLPMVFMRSLPTRNINVDVFANPYWAFCLIFLLLFYLLKLVLIPFFYLKGRHGLYFGIVLLLFGIVYMLKPFDRLMSSHMRRRPVLDRSMPRILPDRQSGNKMQLPDTLSRAQSPQPAQVGSGKRQATFDIVTVFIFITILALTMAIEINKQLQLSQKKAIKAEADRAQAELSFLKAQINPHFLYNTLNNIYTLAITSNPNTAESIMKLSNIMRYITDDITEGFVWLRDELDCISNFIGLQELRLGEKNPVSYVVFGTVDQQKIAPLLLMTFVENAFKYGVSKNKKSPIIIEIDLHYDSIFFYAENRNFAKNDGGKNNTGIGISNTKQRLQYLYPDKHELHIEESEEWFKVSLTIYL